MTLSLSDFTNQSENFHSSYGSVGEAIENYETVLIVDDEELVRRFHSECLSPRYQCFEADSAERALDILNDRQISLVLTDWVMTGMSGKMLLQRVVRDFPDTPVIMVTGVDHPERALDAVRCGAFDYLLKPSKPFALEFAVERAMIHRNLSMKTRQSRIDLELQNIELVKQKSELEKAQARIIYTEKMMSIGQLTAGITHELNNPLGFISGNLQILEQCLRDLRELLGIYEKAEISAKSLAEIETFKRKINYRELIENASPALADCAEGTRRVARLIENLRVFSKLDQPKFNKTNISRDIDSTLKLLGRFFENENIKLVLDYGNLPQIDAYAGHLNQVWMNLLINAARAVGKKGGVIKVTTESAGDFVTVKISDTGEGIARENLSRVFDPFFTTRSIGEGTGLGLYAAYGIVEKHGGTITAESEPGKETVFTVRLPVENTAISASV